MSLLLLFVGTLGLVRLLAWPDFYALLKSEVDGLSVLGVMCIYGVTRMQPGLVSTLQVAKPAVLLAVGFWLLLEWADRQARTSPLASAKRGVALAVAALAALDCLTELTYLGADRAGPRITCCTQFLEVRGAVGSGAVPGIPILADLPQGLVLAVYFALNLLTVAGCRYLSRRDIPGSACAGLIWPLGLLLVGTLGLVATWWAGWDAIAPRVLGLPYHHCIYELITDTDALGLAAALAVIGNGGLLWPVLIQPLRGKAPEAIAAVQKRVYAWCGLMIGSELLIVGVHLL
jgi:hypothetical protein